MGANRGKPNQAGAKVGRATSSFGLYDPRCQIGLEGLSFKHFHR